MGLDISYYRNLRPAPRPLSEDDESTITIYTPQGVPDRSAPLVLGEVYTGEYVGGFRAGSYGGYNAWRDALSEAALGVSASTVWAHPERFAGRPFVELINFSDCEGTIGPEVSAKLARDFAEHAARIRPMLDARRYDAWQQAFTVAAQGGCVDFH